MSAPPAAAYSPQAIALAAQLGLRMGRPNQDVFADTLLELARADCRVRVVTSDSRGSGKLGRFARERPGQIVEVGIAEQNLVGVAAGLAATGKRVFAVSPACFLTARALEQIKNDVAYADHPVCLVGISAGVSYGALGSTHHSLQDLAALRAIPNITVVVPADNAETAAAVRLALAAAHPVYLRLGKAPLYHLGGAEHPADLTRARLLREGRDVCFVATGEAVVHALLAAGQLAESGLTARVLSLPIVKPLDREAVVQAGRQCRAIITVEEHSVHGGLGEACAAALLQAGLAMPFRIVGLPDEETVTGSQADIFRHYGLSMEGLSTLARQLLQTP